jgi:glyoxylase-like metal-dependent hydrolase (beta-lactamase superfamily II)
VRLHHLNCATLRPLGGRRINGRRLPPLPARLVCHCLLLETDRSLVLVDTGFGQPDIDRLGHLWSTLRIRGSRGEELGRRLTRYGYAKLAIRARLDAAETARRRIAALGYSPDDVRDLVLTHLDLDHAGGLPDFPGARIHVREAEHAAAMRAAGSARRSTQRFRYWPYQWAHDPRWITYGGGERWLGFEGAAELDGLPGIALVPLPGHSPGHAGVAVRAGAPGSRWLLHAGDAYFDHREVTAAVARSTPGLAAFQKWLEADGAARRDTRMRLRELARQGEVELFCSHDPTEFDRYDGGSTG